jgi:hypothetical protein
MEYVAIREANDAIPLLVQPRRARLIVFLLLGV